MFMPSLEFLREAVSLDIQAYSVKLLQEGAHPSYIYRIDLHYVDDLSGPSSVIVKLIAPNAIHDPYGSTREFMVYTEILPEIKVPAPELLYFRHDKDSDETILVMQDLEPHYSFPAPQHVWSWSEMCCLLRAYARLHTGGQNLPSAVRRAQWIYKPWEKKIDEAKLPMMIKDLVGWNIWPSIPGTDHLIEATIARILYYSQCSPTFLHNDAYPPNVALPVNLDEEAILIDWGMASWGQPELDLSYLFMQPYRSARMIDRKMALDYYWECRRDLGDSIPTRKVRACRQHHADAVLALAIVSVAHRVACNPYPETSAPQAYWHAMFEVLHEKLGELVSEEYTMGSLCMEPVL